MNNTFWTLIDNEYYRIYDKELKHAPLNKETNSIDVSLESVVEVITPERLELINMTFGTYLESNRLRIN